MPRLRACLRCCLVPFFGKAKRSRSQCLSSGATRRTSSFSQVPYTDHCRVITDMHAACVAPSARPSSPCSLVPLHSQSTTQATQNQARPWSHTQVWSAECHQYGKLPSLNSGESLSRSNVTTATCNAGEMQRAVADVVSPSVVFLRT